LFALSDPSTSLTRVTESVGEICVTANLQRCHRLGTRGWLEEALKKRPAVVFGQELHPRNLGDLPRAHGYTVLEPPVLKSQYWVASWVLARDDLLPEPAGLDLLSPFDSYVAAARLQWPGLGPLTVVSMHASPNPVPLDELSGWPWRAPTPRSGGPFVRHSGRHFYSDMVLEALRVLALDGPVLAAGDLNEARGLDSVHAPATWGEEFFGEVLPRTGLLDVTFGLWGREKRTQFHPTKRGYQVDVVLATPAVAAAVRSAGIDPAWVDPGPDLTHQADHAPLWFTVDCGGP